MPDNNTKIKLGEFIKQRKPDDVNDPFDAQRESFVNYNLPNKDVVINLPSPPKEPIKLGDFKKTSASPRQPAPPLTLPKPPWEPIPIPEPIKTVPAAEQFPHPITPLLGISPEQFPHPETPRTVPVGPLYPPPPKPGGPPPETPPPLPIFLNEEPLIGGNRVPLIPGDDRGSVRNATPTINEPDPRNIRLGDPLPIFLNEEPLIGGNRIPVTPGDERGGVRNVVPTINEPDPRNISLGDPLPIFPNPDNKSLVGGSQVPLIPGDERSGPRNLTPATKQQDPRYLDPQKFEPGHTLPNFPSPDTESILGTSQRPLVPGDDRNPSVHRAIPAKGEDNPATIYGNPRPQALNAGKFETPDESKLRMPIVPGPSGFFSPPPGDEKTEVPKMYIKNLGLVDVIPSKKNDDPRTLGTRYPLPKDLVIANLDEKTQLGGDPSTNPLFIDSHRQVKKVIPAINNDNPHNIKLDQQSYKEKIASDTADSATSSRLDPFGSNPATLVPESGPFYNTVKGRTILDKLKETDKVLFRYLKGVGDGSSLSITTEFGNPDGTPYATSGLNTGVFAAPGAQAWNPILFAKNVVRLGVHLGVNGLLAFAGIQLGLHLLNPVKQTAPFVSIWNPLVLANPPLLQYISHSTINATFGLTHSDSVKKGPGDIHKQIAEGKYSIPFQPLAGLPPFTTQTKIGSVSGPIGSVMAFFFPRLVGAASQDDSLLEGGIANTKVEYFGEPIIKSALKDRNFYQDDNTSTEKAIYLLKDLVEEGFGDGSGVLPILEKNTTLDVERTKFPSGENLIKKFFLFPSDKSPLEFRPGLTIPRKSYTVDPIYKSSFPKGIIPVSFKKDNKQGFIVVPKGKAASEIIDDDDAYVPVSITDMRPIGNKERVVYFRPFLKDIKIELDPQWHETNFLGRVDPVTTYQSTGRSVPVAFEVHAMGPEDLSVMWAKLNWLQSMVYPEVDRFLNYVSGPVVRLRIGDLIASSQGIGLPGTIRGLVLDCGGSTWELRKTTKLPRSVKVSFSFRILHELPIGRGADGKFGGIGKIDPKTGLYNPPSNDPKDKEFITAGKIQYPVITTGHADGFASYPKMNSYTGFEETK